MDSFDDDPIITPEEEIQTNNSNLDSTELNLDSTELNLDSDTSKQKSKEISEEIAKSELLMTPRTKKILYIVLGVLCGLFIVGIVVAVVILSRKSDPPFVSPSVSEIPDRHYPDINEIVSDLIIIPVGFKFNNSSLSQAYLLSQKLGSRSTGDNIGLVLSSNNNPSQFITVDIVKDVCNPFKYILGSDKGNRALSNYISTFTESSSGGTFVNEGKINLFDFDVKNSEIKLSRPTMVPITDPVKVPFSESHNWVTNSSNTTGVNPDEALIVTFYSYDDQTYDIKGYLATSGKTIPAITLAPDHTLAVGGLYKTVLYSSNQSFLSMLFFNEVSNVITDYMYISLDSSIKIIPVPGTGLGSLVSGATESTTSLLMTVFKTSAFFYYRDLSSDRPTFTLVDYFYLPFSGTILHCALDETGTWFVISTTSKKFVFGKINKTSHEVETSSLRYISLESVVGSTLQSTNGPCGIGTSFDNNNLFIFQSDARDGAALFKIPLPLG
jgi:hypothetical protein